MSKLNFSKQLSLLIFVVLFTFSCSKDNELEKTKFLANENFMELSTIKEIASNINFPVKEDSSSLKSTTTQAKSINSINEIRNKSGKTSFYIINYNEGGFVILSADKRTQPILGFSINNNFLVDENSYPLGLEMWMDDAIEQINDIQLSNIEQSPKEKIAWDLVQQSIIEEINTLKREPIEDCYEHTEIYTKGPLMNTTWYQTGGFNDELPYIVCSGSSFQVYAGCVPIAMAQVMKYHQHPTNYNWSSMPLTSATSTTANFIKDIHDAIGNVYNDEPSYECDGTGVSSSANMGNVLISQFNYSNAIKANYNDNTVKSNISYNRPVILSGSNSTSGHMWVCDGYRTTTYYNDDCMAIGYLHFHMNWGWRRNNGWYSFNNFNPGNTNYNNNNKMIYNIMP